MVVVRLLFIGFKAIFDKLVKRDAGLYILGPPINRAIYVTSRFSCALLKDRFWNIFKNKWRLCCEIDLWLRSVYVLRVGPKQWKRVLFHSIIFFHIALESGKSLGCSPKYSCAQMWEEGGGSVPSPKLPWEGMAMLTWQKPHFWNHPHIFLQARKHTQIIALFIY